MNERLELDIEVRVCKECGAIITGSNGWQLASREWVCDDCYETRYFTCDCCGEVHHRNERTIVCNGDYICDSCLDNHYFYCESCGEYHSSDEMTRVYYGRRSYEHYCESCADNYAVWSDDDGEYINEDYCVRVNDDFSCSEWYASDNYYRCDECGEWFTSDYMHTTEEGRDLCDDCYDNYAPHYTGGGVDSDVPQPNEELKVDEDKECEAYLRVNSYHTNKGDETFYGKANKNGLWSGLGFELEVEPNGRVDERKTLRQIYNVVDKHVTFEHDGSLSSGGIEIISQPHTIDEFYKVDWKKMLDTLRANNYISHDSGHCGLHVHLSRNMFGNTLEKQEENIAKMIMFYEKFYDNVVKISRRDMSRAREWADRHYANDLYCNYVYRNSSPKTKTMIEKDYAKKSVKSSDGRYKCVNTKNENTIEIRIMRGTLKSSTFFASIDFILTIAKNSKKISWTKAHSWNEWLKGVKPETLEYIKSKIGSYAFNEDVLPF
jgi:hypothetical protein